MERKRFALYQRNKRTIRFQIWVSIFESVCMTVAFVLQASHNLRVEVALITGQK